MHALLLNRTQFLASLAEGVRAWAQEQARLYPEYFDEDLAGLCALASMRLHDVLRLHQVQAELVISYDDEGRCGHCHVRAADHLLDVTATQFDPMLPDVVCVDLNAPGHFALLLERWYWRRYATFPDSRQAGLYLADEGWPLEQRSPP